MDNTNINLQKPLMRVPLRFMVIASSIPKMKQEKVEKTAQITVQDNTGQKVRDRAPPILNMATKLSKPTQLNKLPGG